MDVEGNGGPRFPEAKQTYLSSLMSYVTADPDAQPETCRHGRSYARQSRHNQRATDSLLNETDIACE